MSNPLFSLGVFRISRAQPLRPISKLRWGKIPLAVFTRMLPARERFGNVNFTTPCLKRPSKISVRIVLFVGVPTMRKKAVWTSKLTIFWSQIDRAEGCLCNPPYSFYFPKNADQKREWLATLRLRSENAWKKGVNWSDVNMWRCTDNKSGCTVFDSLTFAARGRPAKRELQTTLRESTRERTRALVVSSVM